MVDISALLSPSSVAIIGASPDEHKLRGLLLQVMQMHPYTGKIYPVSRSHDEIMGLKAYPAIGDVPVSVDLAVMVIPSRFVADELERCGEAGVRAVLIISSGFAEQSGDDGKAMQETLLEIAQEMFTYADAATMSLKKDGLVNIGGFLVCNNDEWAEEFKNLLILREGFPTYGGLAGRDLEAAAVGLMEALDPAYQQYRHATVQYLAKAMDERDIPYVRPVGGHAVFIDAKAFLPHIPSLQYPGIALVNTLYSVGGIRTVELGTVMFGHFDENGKEVPSQLELVRLAIPRRVYTQSHFDYIVEVLDDVKKNISNVNGYKIT